MIIIHHFYMIIFIYFFAIPSSMALDGFLSYGKVTVMDMMRDMDEYIAKANESIYQHRMAGPRDLSEKPYIGIINDAKKSVIDDYLRLKEYGSDIGKRTIKLAKDNIIPSLENMVGYAILPRDYFAMGYSRRP